MAWGTGTVRGTANNKTAALSIAFSPSSTVPAGETAVLFIAKDNTSAGADGDNNEVTSVTDTKSNTWTKAVEWGNTNAGAGLGAVGAIFISDVGTAILTSDTITVNFSAATTAKAVTLASFTKGAGNVTTVNGSAGASADNTTTPTVTLSGQGAAEKLWIGGLATEGPVEETYTADADFAAVDFTESGTTGGGGGGNMTANAESDVDTVASLTYNPTVSLARDHATVLATFTEAAPPAAVPLRTLTLLGVGM